MKNILKITLSRSLQVKVPQPFAPFVLEEDTLVVLFIIPRVPIVEVLMITNQGYWLLMVKIELNNRLKFIKHQMKILQTKDENGVVDQALRSEVHSNKITKMTSNQDSKLKHQVKTLSS